MTFGRATARLGVALALGALAFGWPGRAQAARADPAAERSPAVEQDYVPGEALERELPAGGAQAYALPLQAGDFVEALVEQRGADVSVSVDDPQGRPALDVDANEDPLRFERVLWIAELPGTHRLVVRAKGQRGGRYRLTLERPRPASPDDRRRAAAARAYDEGLRLQDEDQDAKRELAGTHLLAAVAGFRAAGDKRAEAEALERLGNVQSSLGRDAQWLESARRALELFEAVGDRMAAAWTHTQVGWASGSLGDVAVARSHLEEAVRTARQMDDAWAEAAFLNHLGDFLRRRSEVEEAIEHLERASTLARRAGNATAAAYALNNLGIAYRSLGEYAKALASFEQALPLFRAMSKGMEARLYLNMGNVHRSLGEYPQALELYQRYLAFARDAGSADDEARALNNMAMAHHLLGEYGPALEEAQRSLELRRALGNRSLVAQSLRNVGETLDVLGRGDEAVAALQEALRMHRELGEVRSEPEALLSLAKAERRRGNLELALERIQESIRLTEALRARLTSPELRASFVAVGQEKYELLVDLQMRLQERDPASGHATAALEASEAARARVLLEALVEARADVRQGIDPGLLEQERALQKQLGEASDRLGRLLAAKAPEAKVSSATVEAEELSGRYQQLLARIRQTSPAYAALMQPSPLRVAEIQRDVLDPDTVLLEYALGDERSFLFVLTPGELASFALPGRVEIEKGAREVYALLTARQGAGAPGAADRLRGADESLRERGAVLSGLLLGPVADRLRGEWSGKRLAIVASGALAYLPFGALPQPGGGTQRLLDSHEIVTLPSASVLAALRRQLAGRALASPKLAVLADPVFDPQDPRVTRARAPRPGGEPGGRPSALLSLTRSAEGLGRTAFSRLPFSRQEAGAIAALAAPGTLTEAVDFQASRSWVESGSLAGRSIVHFATHGLLNSEHPDLSGLVLSLVDEQAAWQDGFLRMADIYNLRLDAELVVLSACQTALGREVRGEGLIGVTRGFMYAGAPRVVASLWEVDDQSTAELMRIFYRGLLREKRRPAEALRLAQIEISRQKRWAAPYYWAGFVLQGEWR